MYILSVMYIISIIQIIFLTIVVSYFSGVISDDENETSNQDNPVDREDMPVFPYKNKVGRLIVDTEKAHSIKHCHVDYANPIINQALST